MMASTHLLGPETPGAVSIFSPPFAQAPLYVELRLIKHVIAVSPSTLRRKAKRAEVQWIASGADLGLGYLARRIYLDWHAARLWLVANGHADPAELLMRQSVTTRRRVSAALTVAEAQNSRRKQAP
jgi:hypothetical protein